MKTATRLLLTATAALGLLTAAGTALADHDHHGRRGWDGDRDRYEYRHPHYRPPYYGPAPVVVYPPYYAPPPPRVVYGPTYYYPPQPAGVSIGVNVPPIVIPFR